jgi:hypothetical protein
LFDFLRLEQRSDFGAKALTHEIDFYCTPPISMGIRLGATMNTIIAVEPCALRPHCDNHTK